MGRLTSRMLVGGAVLLALVAGIFTVLRQAVVDVRDSSDAARHSQEVLTATGDLHTLAVEMQNGVRGYVITGARPFLEPYARARRQLEPRLGTLEALVRDDPAQTRRTRAVGRALRSYVDDYAARMIAATRRDRATAQRLVAQGKGRRRLNAIRARIAELERAERAQAHSGRETAEASARRAALLGVGGIAAAMALIALFVAVLGRSVVGPVRRVAGAADALARGDLSTRVPETGAGEIGELGGAFNDMAQALESTVRELNEQRETARRQAEALESTVGELAEEREAAHRQAALNQAVLETAHDAFVSMDSEGTILEWNTRAEAMFGWPSAIAVGRNLAHTIIPPAYRAAHQEGLRRFLATGDGRVLNRRLELTGLHRDGTEFPVELTISPLRLGDTYRFNAFIADAGARHRAARFRDAQHAVVQSLAAAGTLETALHGALQALGDGLDWDVAVFWSASGEGAYRVLRCEQVWHTPETAAFADALRPLALEPGAGLAGRVWVQGASAWAPNVLREEDLPWGRAAARYGMQSAFCVPVLSEGGLVGAIELISTESRRRDDDLLGSLDPVAAQLGEYVRRKRAEVESDRVKREFFALVSHELRTPLTSILGYLELLREDGDLTPDGLRFVEVIDRNADRLLRLVGDLLFVAQVEAGKFALQTGPVAMEEVVRQAVEAACPRATERGIALRVTADAVGELEGDRDRLAQLLDNLVSNALKFTPPGGEVEVALARGADVVVLEVRDSGMGIPDDEQERLFERFYRTEEATDRAIGGAGLGLTISKAIVEGHHGAISVASREGAGTTFRVELPVGAAAPRHAAARA